MPATILIITYIPSAAQREAPSEARRAVAEHIAALDGLRWKYWLNERDAAASGGVYLFATLDQARAAGDGLKGSLEEAGAKDISLRFFDIDAELSTLTRGLFP